MRFNVEFVIGIAYIALMGGLAWASVGIEPEPSPFPWYLPIITVGFCGFPFIVGYSAGKRS